MAGDGAVEAGLGLAGPKQPLLNSNASSTGQRSPAARISRALLSGWPSGTKQ